MNEYMIGCPECSMAFGMNSTLSKADDGFKCTTNPMHKFIMDNSGFLKSLQQ